MHAFNATGVEPGLATRATGGWPKFTGGWTVGPPAVGDFNGDGRRDIAHSIREGRLFVWNGNGADVCDPASWPEFGHDGCNTNAYHTDDERPRVITNLVASTSTLGWTAPGDDGNCGHATAYEVRRSTAPITAVNFSEAEAVPGAPIPGSPGNAQSMPLAGSAKSYFYAIRTLDDASNVSAVSNVALVDGPDEDEDGFSDVSEVAIGTDPLDACANTTAKNDEPAPDAWPPDFNDDTFVDTFDIAQATGRFGLGVPPASPCVDLAPEPPNGFIDTGDIGRITGLFGQSCMPP